MEKKIAHLEMLQGIINRLSQNSFLLKGWSVILVSALFALAVFSMNQWFLLLALIPALAFWLLDGYYQLQVRLFRNLYDHVRTKNEDEIDFSMDVTPFQGEKDAWASFDNWLMIAFSKSLAIFHGVIVVVIFGALRIVSA